MASLNTDKRGNRRLQFKAPTGKRATVYLGKLPLRQAQTVKSYVERLIVAAASGDSIDTDTAVWLGRITDELHGKLVRAGLVAEKETATLGEFLQAYIESRSDVKPLTVEHYKRVQTDLVDCFGADRPLREITAGDADGFRLYLLGKELAENTARRRCGRAKQFFTAAVRRQLIASNPFADLKTRVGASADRFYYVTRDEAQKVLDACPDSQWRLLFALVRFGGLRCPSEPLALRWGDVDWECGRIRVRSPKTEHHEGGESRVIPIFPELRPYLEESRELAEPGTEYVITRYRDSNSNLRTQLGRIIRRAGLTPWEKPFANCRSTRETELAERFPLHVVCAWIGNSQPVAAKHYLQVTEDHFQRALGSAETVTQNATYPAHVKGGKAQHAEPRNPVFTEKCGALRNCTNVKAPRRGLEPRTQRLTAACSTN